MNKKERLKLISFIFFLPLFVIIIGLSLDIFGRNNNWCWIKGELGESVAFFFNCFLWILIIFNATIILYSNCKMRNIIVFNSSELKKIQYFISYVRKISIFSLILIICWVPASLNRILIFFFVEKNDVIQLLHLIFILNLRLFILLGSFLFVDWTDIIKWIKIFFKAKCCLHTAFNKRKSIRVSSNSNNYLLSSSDFAN